MRLYVLRHGKAGDRETWTGDDRERPLTDEGREEMRGVAQGLRWLDLGLETLITSPLVRARETADCVAEAIHPPQYVNSDLLSPGCDLRALGKLLAQYSGSQQVMIVGHEPDLSSIIGELIGSNGLARVQLKKAACCCLKLDGIASGSSGAKLAGKGTLVWHLPAEVLVRLGR
jgi:phosphohistidine phosphatase